MKFHFPENLQTWLWFAFLASFAVKLPMWPAHILASRRTCRSANGGFVILAAILLKMGGYGFLRFSLPMFPEASLAYAPLMFALGVAAILYTSLVAFAQKDMKKLIAYSSVAHMGFVTLGVFSGTFQGAQGANDGRHRVRGALPFQLGSSTTGCTRVKSRPMAGSPTGCRSMPLFLWSSPWPTSACRAQAALSANS